MFQSIGKYVGNKAKGRISKRVFQGIETCQIFRKNEHFLYPPPPLGKRHRNISRKTKVLTNINMQVLSERLLSVGQTFQNSQEMHLFCNNNKKNLSPFRDVISMSKIFFPRTTRLWYFLPTECFHLTSDLNDCKSRVNIHLFSLETF